MATRTMVNRQVRGFALVWTTVTIIIGMSTFFAIYLTYGGTQNVQLGENSGNSIALQASDTPDQGAVVAPPTAEPTDLPPTPTPTTAPTETAETVAMAQELEQEQPTNTPAPTLLPTADTDYHVGIQVQYSLDLNPDTQRIWMNDVQNLGMDWMKMQVRWEDVELAQGEYDWSKLDLALPVADEYGIHVLLSIVTAPEWARESGVNLEEEGPPADYATYANFVATLVERYQGQVHAIEVWNEQNLAREWTSNRGLSASDYVSLLRQTYTAIKDIDPGIIVISGALSPTGVSDGVIAIDDFTYMDQLIEAGMLNYADCVGAHHNGYNIGPNVTWDNVPPDPDAQFRGPFDNPNHSWSFRSTLQTYANKIALAESDLKLCVTEFGWATVEDLDGVPQNFEFALDNTLQEQADFTVKALNLMDEWDIVWIAIVWNLNYGPQAGWNTESDNVPYSIIGPEFARRPVFDAIVAWNAQRREQETE